MRNISLAALSEMLERKRQKQLQAATIELCDAGLLTCTRGKPGEANAKYALAWLPLDNPEQFSEEVRAKHAENMRRCSADTTQRRSQK